MIHILENFFSRRKLFSPQYQHVTNIFGKLHHYVDNLRWIFLDIKNIIPNFAAFTFSQKKRQYSPLTNFIKLPN